MTRQRGFTLLELLVSLAIFSLLGLASARLFDGVFRVQEQVREEEQALHALRRAVAVIERDVLQAVAPAKQPAVRIQPGLLNLYRGNWLNPLGHPRGERQEVSYVLEQAQLWRYSRSPDVPGIQKQRLLNDVRQLEWRLYDQKRGWRSDWPAGAHSAPPRAVEMVFSAGRFERIRRVIPLVGEVEG